MSLLCSVSCLFHKVYLLSYAVYLVYFMQCILSLLYSVSCVLCSVSCLFHVCFMQCILSVSCLFYAVYLVCFMQCCFTTPRSGDASHFSICCCWFDSLKANGCGGCVPSCCRDRRSCFPAPGWRLARSGVHQHRWRSRQQM